MGMGEQNKRNIVVPLLKEDDGNVQVEEQEKKKVSVDLQGKQYASIDDFDIELKAVEKLWKSKGKILTIMPMSKGDRDEVLKPINGQKIEAQADGSTKGFYISLDLFEEIKKGVIEKSLKHYTGKDGKPIMTRKKLEGMPNEVYDELAEICLSVNKIDFFEANKSDVASGAEVKN